MRKTEEKQFRYELLDSLAQKVEIRIEDQKASIDRYYKELEEEPDKEYLNEWIQEAKEKVRIYLDIMDYLAKG